VVGEKPPLRPLAVGDATVIEHLEQLREHIGMGLFTSSKDHRIVPGGARLSVELAPSS